MENKLDSTVLHPFLQKVDEYPEAIFIHHTRIEEKLSMHSHQKHQMAYVEGGVAFLNTQKNSYFFPARHFIWIPAGLEHQVASRTSVKMAHNFFFPADLFPPNDRLQRGGIFPVTDLLKEMIYHCEDWTGNIMAADNTKYEFMIAFRNIVIEAATNPLPVVLPTTKNERLRPVLVYIHRHIDQPLYLENVAAEFGYSPRTLSRLFQKNISTSFLQYIKLTRVIKGMELLLQTDLSISEIAYSTGHSSLAAFSYAFQQIVNRSPTEFKKQSL
ncbi:AraC family transcriptional regulator [Aequorivita capsosiphonis]|uniref:AraC family transcriptional regulator n=1 Tax=Aequorivita capsosiphonis TaxID=487317 RepID=UPI00041664C2|nr:AraC family transcriptional regulator [Aequorivita capsosiphonis]